MRTFFVLACLSLAACAAPSLDTHWVRSDLAGRCKLMAYKEDSGNNFILGYVGLSGLAANAIADANTAAKRQAIFDACVQAVGTREQPPEVLN